MIGSFPHKRFDSFGPIYYPQHQKQVMKKHEIPAPVDASKMCQMEVYYDGDIHDAVANLRRLDGTLCTLNMECQLIFLPQGIA